MLRLRHNRFLAAWILVSVVGVTTHAGELDPRQDKWIRKYEKQRNVPEPGEMLLNTDSEPDLASGFRPLFNVKDLTGWTPKGGACTFEAKNGQIVGTCVPGASSTYLCTEDASFSDFVFTCELKWEVDGNSGIMFRAQSKTENGKETVFGPQAEMEAFSKQRFWSGGIYGQSCGGWLYPMWLDAHKKARKAMRKDAWNRITIKAQGNNVKTWLNGVPAAHWETDEYLKGFFSLQIHAGAAGTVHFRNLKVKELTAASGG